MRQLYSEDFTEQPKLFHLFHRPLPSPWRLEMNDAEPIVRSVVVRGVDAPMAMPLHASTGALTSAPLVLIDLETSAGTVGRAYLFAFTRANVKPVAALVEAMGEMIVGDP